MNNLNDVSYIFVQAGFYKLISFSVAKINIVSSFSIHLVVSSFSLRSEKTTNLTEYLHLIYLWEKILIYENIRYKKRAQFEIRKFEKRK